MACEVQGGSYSSSDTAPVATHLMIYVFNVQLYKGETVLCVVYRKY